MKHCLWVGLLVLSGCAGAAATPDTGVEAEPLLTVTPEGLTGLATDIAINAIAIQRAFPDLEVVSSAYGKRYAVRMEGETLSLIEPTGAVGYRVKLLSEKTTGPRGIRVGDSFSEIASLASLECRRGAGEWASQVYCTSPATAHVVYGFDAAEVETGDCTVDCLITDLRGLQESNVRMIDWQR